MESGPSWYAFQLRPHREESVKTALLSKGYEVFLPTFRERRFRSGRIRIQERALFPGYVCCKFTPDLTGKVVTTPGVIRVVSFGRKPVAIPEEEITRIQAIVTSDLAREPWRYIPGGTSIRIETGPLRGVEGILIDTNGNRRLVVSIGLLERSIAVSLDETTDFRVLSIPVLKRNSESAFAATLLQTPDL